VGHTALLQQLPPPLPLPLLLLLGLPLLLVLPRPPRRHYCWLLP